MHQVASFKHTADMYLPYCALQTLFEICIYNVLKGKKLKKRKNKKFAANFNKKMGFLILHQNASWVFYSKIKQVFSY